MKENLKSLRNKSKITQKMGKTTQKHIIIATQKKKIYKINADLDKNPQKKRNSNKKNRKSHKKFLKYYYPCVFKILCKEEPSNTWQMWTMCLFRNCKKNLPI